MESERDEHDQNITYIIKTLEQLIHEADRQIQQSRGMGYEYDPISDYLNNREHPYDEEE